MDGDVEDHAVVVADEISLHQVVMNLCVNARDAMPEGGHMALRVSTLPPGAARGFETQRVVRVEVVDTGEGMDAGTTARIFEPFFSTKGRQGNGIGLAVTRSLVEQFGGRIRVRSEVGRGTEFQLDFPAAMPQPRTCAGRNRRVETVGMQRTVLEGTVLVVDDEQLLRRIARRVLEMAGMTVVEAADGREAITAYTLLDQPPDLVLLDLDMPEMGGEEAQRLLRGLDPGARIVVLTGHQDEARAERLRAQGALMVLRKPLHPERLVEVVHRFVGEGRAP